MFSRSSRVLFRGLRIRKFSSENSDLLDDKIRDSFFHAFIPDINIKSSTRIDDHMDPIEKLQILRTFLNSKTNKTIASNMRKSDFNVMKRVSKEKFVPDLEFSKFVRDLLRFYNHISDSFPEQLYGGKMDFACQLENTDYALVEMQVIPSDDWDRRALAYISAFYGNQLRRGGQWNNLKKVIGVNILGGSRDDQMFWSNRKPCEYMRHFKFQNQVSGNTDIFIDAVELFQYSLISPPPSSISIEAKDWLTFLSRAAFMTEEDVKREIKTPEVLLAFDRAKISQLPTQVLEAYQAETSKFQMYSQYTADLVLEGKLGEKFEIAQRMISMSFDDSVIIKTTGLSHADLTIIKDSLS